MLNIRKSLAEEMTKILLSNEWNVVLKNKHNIRIKIFIPARYLR